MARFTMRNYDPRADSSPGTEAWRPGYRNNPEGLEGLILDWRDPPGSPHLSPCPCGCTNPVTGKGAKFVMGHDARFKGILTRAYIAAVPVHILHNPANDDVLASIESVTAEQVARKFSTERYDWVAAMKESAEKIDGAKGHRAAMTDRRVLQLALRDHPDRKLLSVGRWEKTGHLLAIWIGSDLRHHYAWTAADGKFREADVDPKSDEHDETGAE